MLADQERPIGRAARLVRPPANASRRVSIARAARFRRQQPRDRRRAGDLEALHRRVEQPDQLVGGAYRVVMLDEAQTMLSLPQPKRSPIPGTTQGFTLQQ